MYCDLDHVRCTYIVNVIHLASSVIQFDTNFVIKFPTIFTSFHLIEVQIKLFKQTKKWRAFFLETVFGRTAWETGMGYRFFLNLLSWMTSWKWWSVAAKLLGLQHYNRFRWYTNNTLFSQIRPVKLLCDF